ncbi:MAG: hypothetical protein DWQ58_07905 [Microcystis aeruginosa TA09]|nr:MAG: hypothetical protein DWQ58_07905 [Microcystis aeruginosa TA09]
MPPIRHQIFAQFPHGCHIQLSVISYQLSVVSYQLSVISYQLSVVSYQLSVNNFDLLSCLLTPNY